jgi:hypothetical protein
MPMRTTRAAILALAWLTPGCGHRRLQQLPSATSVVVAVNESTRATIDTARLEARGDTIRLWIRYDMTRPAINPDSTHARVFRMDVLTDTDCHTKVAQDVMVRTYDSLGSLQMEHQFAVPDWQPFGSEGQTEHVHRPVCEVLQARAHAGRS